MAGNCFEALAGFCIVLFSVTKEVKPNMITKGYMKGGLPPCLITG